MLFGRLARWRCVEKLGLNLKPNPAVGGKAAFLKPHLPIILNSRLKMAYDEKLAERVREYLVNFPGLKIEAKNMFGGLAFMVNGKMCVNVSGENLMCRFDPSLLEEVAKRKGFQKMTMKGREYKGYCYVNPDGFKVENDFKYWIDLCLAFNEQAKSSKK